jgi:hypothetical protein
LLLIAQCFNHNLCNLCDVGSKRLCCFTQIEIFMLQLTSKLVFSDETEVSVVKTIFYP